MSDLERSTVSYDSFAQEPEAVIQQRLHEEDSARTSVLAIGALSGSLAVAGAASKIASHYLENGQAADISNGAGTTSFVVAAGAGLVSWGVAHGRRLARRDAGLSAKRLEEHDLDAFEAEGIAKRTILIEVSIDPQVGQNTDHDWFFAAFRQ